MDPGTLPPLLDQAVGIARPRAVPAAAGLLSAPGTALIGFVRPLNQALRPWTGTIAMRAYTGSLALLVAIVIVFGFEVAKGVVADDAGLIRSGALPDTVQLHGEYWRLMTFGFMHWNATHLLLNIGLLLAVAPIAERRVGAVWLLAVFAASSVMSGIGILVKHVLWSAPGASVGASGGMFGLLGLALVLVIRNPGQTPRARYGLGAISACAFLYSVLPGISMVGHVVGFTVGAAMGCAVSSLRPGNSSKPTPLRGAA